jgi:molybdate transport system substrate-binding protein
MLRRAVSMVKVPGLVTHRGARSFFLALVGRAIVTRGALLLPAGAALAGGAAAAGNGAPPERQGHALLVFAAASLTNAVGDIGEAFTARTGVALKCSFASSSVLARQIEAGAPADLFLSADTGWMDYLERRGLLRPGTRRDLLGNELVLIAPVGSSVHLTLAPGVNLAAALSSGRLATGDPDSVPAGRYAKAALTSLGLWGELSSRLARAENVRAALEYVARGEAPLGIVYRTDALAEKRVRVVAVFPAASHPPIVYPVALTARAGAEAAAFEDFLLGDEARRIFSRYGFEQRVDLVALPR